MRRGSAEDRKQGSGTEGRRQGPAEDRRQGSATGGRRQGLQGSGTGGRGLRRTGEAAKTWWASAIRGGGG